MESHLELEINARPAGEVWVVDVSGEIDLYTSPRVSDCFQDLIGGGHLNLVANLDKVRYMDSTGLGILMQTVRRLDEAGGRLVLVCTNPRVLKIFQLTGFLQTFSIFSRDEEAVASFAPG